MMLLPSGIDDVPTLNMRSDIWDCVEFYAICMLFACRLKIIPTSNLKLIISFLVLLILVLSFFKLISVVALKQHTHLTLHTVLRLANRPSAGVLEGSCCSPGSAAVEPKKVNKATLHLHLCLGLLFALLDHDKHNAVALYVLLPVLVADLVFGQVVMHVYGGHARALPLEAHYLQLDPQKVINWVQLVLPHLLTVVILGNKASAALASVAFHHLFHGLPCKRPCADWVLPG
jgi:hypothetical protein